MDKMVMQVKLIVLLFLFFVIPVNAAEVEVGEWPRKGPLIEKYGPVFEAPRASFPLALNTRHRVLFDVAHSPRGHDALNRRLESVARYMNMHARAGLEAGQMDIAVIMHGSASWNALSDTAYQKRFNRNNPNTDLIRALKSAGVRFWLCGQSAGFNGIADAELSADVGLALSAMTVIGQLQAEGFSLLP